MEKIQEVMYLPSLRCNLKCKHCGENQNVKAEDEIDCIQVLEQMKNSIMLDVTTIVITGGEPFLNRNLSYFITEAIKTTKFYFDITSNGFYHKEIQNMVIQVEEKDRSRISFSISIDGLERTHNQIRRNSDSFARAIETVKILVKYGIRVSINTVVQESNLHELDKLKMYIKEISPLIVHSFIPLAVDIAGDSEQIYTEEYQRIMWKHSANTVDKKKILSKGNYKLHNCHAGEKNIVIGPDGKMYACLTGAYYKGDELREEFCFGDLKKSTFDEILLDTERRDKVQNKTVMMCEGCSNPCEINREQNLFGKKVSITQTELPLLFKLGESEQIGKAILDYSGWYPIERYDEKHSLCWQGDIKASAFLMIEEASSISISYRKFMPNVKVKILINGKEAFIDYEERSQNTVIVNIPPTKDRYIIITFLANELVSPSNVYASEDYRCLGIGLEGMDIL